MAPTGDESELNPSPEQNDNDNNDSLEGANYKHRSEEEVPDDYNEDIQDRHRLIRNKKKRRVKVEDEEQEDDNNNNNDDDNDDDEDTLPRWIVQLLAWSTGVGGIIADYGFGVFGQKGTIPILYYALCLGIGFGINPSFLTRILLHGYSVKKK